MMSEIHVTPLSGLSNCSGRAAPPQSNAQQPMNPVPLPPCERALVWFRRDLRNFDHAALYHARSCARAVYTAFVFDREILHPLPRADRTAREGLVGEGRAGAAVLGRARRRKAPRGKVRRTAAGVGAGRATSGARHGGAARRVTGRGAGRPWEVGPVEDR